jgi:dipeptidyl aminopeptidase/acylaminoacyl peptidase
VSFRFAVTARRLLLVASVVVVPALTAVPAHAAFPGQNGKIAFSRSFQESLFTRKAQIWTVNPDGSGQTVVNDTTGYDRRPAWSPDGQKIAFARVSDPSVDGTHEIYVMNEDGTGATRLTNNSTEDLAPTWSPDGQRIAFMSIRDGNWDIYAMNADGTGQVNLTNPADASLDPAWSPDGGKIAFRRSGSKTEVWVMNPDGTGQASLTSTLSHASEPAYSPDGRKIAFTGLDGIYVMNADGSGATRVIVGSTDAGASDPAWSPDGQKFAFVRGGPRCGTGCFPAEIAAANVDGSGEIQLTNTGPSMPNSGPDWQPAPGSARPLAAAQLRVPLVVAYPACNTGSANRTHGPSLAAPSCNPATPTSSYLTVGTVDANGQSAQSVGYARFTVCTSGPTVSGVCSTPTAMTSPDVRLEVRETDLRRKSDLSDYAGELRATSVVRITDRHNSTTPGGTGDAATTVDMPYSFTVSCAATPTGDVGSTCAVVTSANTVAPGSVVGSKRAIWELGQIVVHDGGSDGDAETTADNSVFAKQGIFIP